jgi:hypothetical protein
MLYPRRDSGEYFVAVDENDLPELVNTDRLFSSRIPTTGPAI